MRKKMWEYDGFDDYKQSNPDTFKNHVASFRKLNVGNDCIITFAKPDSKDGAMQFTYIDGVLSVNGDYGYAVFNWYNPKNHILAYGTFNSFGYVLSKLVAVKDDELYGWDEDLFHKEFKEFIQDRTDEGYIKEDVDKEDFEAPNCYSLNDVINHFQDNNKYGDDLFETSAYTLGRYIKVRPYLWWFGLQTALKLLEEQGVFKDS